MKESGSRKLWTNKPIIKLLNTMFNIFPKRAKYPNQKRIRKMKLKLVAAKQKEVRKKMQPTLHQRTKQMANRLIDFLKDIMIDYYKKDIIS
jgi:hypothetical protein